MGNASEFHAVATQRSAWMYLLSVMCVVGIYLLVLAVGYGALCQRYEIVALNQVVGAVRIDKMTGKVWRVVPHAQGDIRIIPEP